MKGRKLLAGFLSAAMVIGTMAFPVFAEGNALPAAVEGVITLTEDVVLETETVIEDTEINLNGNTITLSTGGILVVTGRCEIYGGDIKTAEGYYSQDGMIRVGYYYDDKEYSLTLNQVDIIAKGADVSTGVFCIGMNSSISLLESTVTAIGTKEDDMIAVFYAGSGLCGDINIQGSTITTEKANAVFYRVNVDIDDSTLNVTNNYKPVFRGTEGVVNDTVITVTGILGSDNRAFIEALDANSLVFDGNTTVTTDSETPFVKQSDVDSNAITVIAAPNTTLPENAADIVETYVASIGSAKYLSLSDAVVAAQNGETVELLGNVSGDGVVVSSGSNITIDLGGYTYNVDGTTVGSAGTETQAFQLLKNSNITIKNGTITSDKAKMLIQNYSNLTLENVTLDGTNLVGANRYVLSNNNGDTVLKGNTNIVAKDGDFAFDCCYWPDGGYGKVTVTLGADFTGKITGEIEKSYYGSTEEEANENSSISISAGTFTTDVSAFLADGYEVKDNGDGTYTVKAAEEGAKLFDKIAVLYGGEPWLFAGIDSLNYGKAGFKYTIDGVESEMEATIICDQVISNDRTVTAAELGGKYIFGIALNEQFKNAFTVKPFVDGTIGTAVEFQAAKEN